MSFTPKILSTYQTLWLNFTSAVWDYWTFLCKSDCFILNMCASDPWENGPLVALQIPPLHVCILLKRQLDICLALHLKIKIHFRANRFWGSRMYGRTCVGTTEENVSKTYKTTSVPELAYKDRKLHLHKQIDPMEVPTPAIKTIPGYTGHQVIPLLS